ncbi:MAG: nucleoside recognition domain-containing protein, partial [Tissierellia bacterium]|nr:nucleoside recognition domain-containing protein [Tissierellia bacterium]
MSAAQKEVLSKQEILDRNLDLEDLPVIDSFSIANGDVRIGAIKFVIFTMIAIFIFFVPITIDGKTDITFGLIYNGLQKFAGNFGLWMITLMVVATALSSVYGKYIAKEGKLHDYFAGDSIVHPILYIIGAVFCLLYSLTATTSFQGPEIIVGAATGGTVIPSIAVAVFWIIFVSSFAMPFLINYGFIDFIGALMEPLMRPIFKLPGRAAVNAIVSFLSSSSVGVLITNKLYRRRVYTEKEAVLVATGFSAVSVGFAYMVIKTAGLQEHFVFVYLSSAVVTLIISGIIARLPPFNKKRDIYLDGQEQTIEDIKAQRSAEGAGVLKTGVDRAIKKAFMAPPLLGEIKGSLLDSAEVIPKVVTTICVIGTGAMIIAENTPLFEWMGLIFLPLLNLLKVPDAAQIAASFPVGLAEMMLPVLLIAPYVDE